MKKIILAIFYVTLAISILVLVMFNINKSNEQKNRIIEANNLIEAYLVSYNLFVESGPIYYFQEIGEKHYVYTRNEDKVFYEQYNGSDDNKIFFYQNNTYYEARNGSITNSIGEGQMQSLIEMRIFSVNLFFERLIEQVKNNEIQWQVYENGIYAFNYFYDDLEIKEDANVEINIDTNTITVESESVLISIELRFEVLFELGE